MKVMPRAIVILMLAASVLVPLAGCGDSQAARQREFAKYARKKAPEERDDYDDPPTPAAAQQPVASSSNTVRAPSSPAGSANPGGTPNSTAAVAPGLPAASSSVNSTGPLSDTKSPPATALTVEQRRQMTIDNLTKIGLAIEQYRTEHGVYPAPFISNTLKQPLLSWRVALLPYLGYDKLYARFKLNESWDSTHNAALVPQIPSIYQSPDRFDMLTNYLVPTASSTAFFGYRGKSTRRWEDGAENTIILVEADDAHAVPWTQPVDLDFDAMKPLVGLSGLRSDGTFVAWGGATIGLVPKGVDPNQLRGAFTVDAGEVLDMTALRKPAMAQLGGLAAQLRRSVLPTTPNATSNGGVTAADAPSTVSSQPVVSDSAIALASSTNAQAAFAEGRETDAIRIYYGDLLAGIQGETWQYQYRWIPGLSRPAPIVRYGVGIAMTGARASKAKQLGIDALAKKTTVNDAFGKLAGGFGSRVLETLKKRSTHSPFRMEPPKPKRPRRRRSDDDDDRSTAANEGVLLAAGIEFVGVGTEHVLTHAAHKHEVDALVLFDIDEKRVGGRWTRDVRLQVVDVVRRKTVFTGKKLNSKRVAIARNDLLQDDPTDAAIADFASFLKAKMVAVEMPGQLKSTHAAKRIRALGSAAHENPLRAMAEMRLYRQLELVDLEQLMNGYAQLLDQKSALTLLGGSLKDKIEVLRPYLPESS